MNSLTVSSGQRRFDDGCGSIVSLSTDRAGFINQPRLVQASQDEGLAREVVGPLAVNLGRTRFALSADVRARLRRAKIGMLFRRFATFPARGPTTSPTNARPAPAHKRCLVQAAPA